METRILQVSASDVKFTPCANNTHPFDDPQLEMEEPTRSRIAEASRLLRDQNAISFPTETVYGLGANALSSEAVSKIYAAKNRPADNPLILHISSLKSLRRLLPPSQPIPTIYTPLIDKFWPGPLTILLPLDSRHSGISHLCTNGQSTFAVRMPSHPLALALLHTSGLPLAAPSANTSTRPSPTTAQHVHHDLQGLIPLILDGGPCSVGLESTVVDGFIDPPQILRPGGLSIEQIRSVPGWEKTTLYRPDTTVTTQLPPRTPGMKYRHYSPTAKIILYEPTASRPDLETLRESGTSTAAMAICRTRLWSSDLARSIDETVLDCPMGTTGLEISQTLFALLRSLDDRGVKTILMEGVSEDDEGLAIMNRMRKAATVIVH